MKKFKHIIGGICIVLVLGYYAGITCFPHTHTYTWGTVTHSHPYSSTHHHTTTALQFIAHMATLLFLATSWLFALFISFLLKNLVAFQPCLVVSQRIILTHPRSPPVVHLL